MADDVDCVLLVVDCMCMTLLKVVDVHMCVCDCVWVRGFSWPWARQAKVKVAIRKDFNVYD